MGALSSFSLLSAVAGLISSFIDVPPTHESLHFQLADQNDTIGKECLKYSDAFCLTGWFTDQSTRLDRKRSEMRDHFRFWDLAITMFRAFNWFSFLPYEAGTCCSFQTKVYMEHGQKKGISPEEYYDRITNFSSAGKQLNFLMVIVECQLDYLRIALNGHHLCNYEHQLDFTRADHVIVSGDIQTHVVRVT
ncbi:uncharacterized protein LOC142349155 [Convolutriloba macropyga]|uniref:uncharacterized protein LOC142349155 n=1 Tax=Convolutriloba macropyga TaxID=536237 RepID=UPI003F51F49E